MCCASARGRNRCRRITRGYYLGRLGDMTGELAAYERAETCVPDYCFPNKLEDIAVLTRANECNPDGAKSRYYLGCLYYDKLQFDLAQQLWSSR